LGVGGDGFDSKPRDCANSPDGLLYSNGIDNGIIRDRAYYPWPVSTPGDMAHKQYAAYPPARHITFYNAMCFGVINDHGEDVIIHSTPGKVGIYNKARDYLRYKHAINCMFAVDDGLVVSTDNAVYFVDPTAELPTSRMISSEPIVLNAVNQLPLTVADYGVESFSVKARVANTTAGPTLFAASGYSQNLIRGLNEIRDSKDNAVLVTDETLIITTKEV